MIRSMTGFGAETVVRGNKSLTVEIRSLNHRYCEINIRLPKKLFFLENEIKSQIKEVLLRGKIDVYITYQYADGSDTNIAYNQPLVERYVSEINKMSRDLLLENDLTVTGILGLPDLFISQDEEEEEGFLEDFIKETVGGALQKMIGARQTEGKMLKANILDKLEEIESLSRRLPDLEKQSVQDYRLSLSEKVRDLLSGEDIEESRILTETAIMADKLSIDEEIVRLQGHIMHMRKVLKDEVAIGKKMDFIVQEMNREVNTLCSKSINMEVKNIAIDCKNIIEKIREQVQNIE